MEQGPDALKLTGNPEDAVAVTVTGELVMTAELGSWLKAMVWFTVRTAGGEGAL